jgi:hypothetical protein
MNGTYEYLPYYLYMICSLDLESRESSNQSCLSRGVVVQEET